MKEGGYFIIGAVVLLAACIFLPDCIRDSSDPEETYCGVVTDLYLTSVGGKGGHTQHRLVFHCPKVARKINISVSPSCYSNASKGKSICFELRKSEID